MNPINRVNRLVAGMLIFLLPLHGIAIPLADRPLFLNGDVPPRVMINISKDHQLTYKAYNDYSDLDDDGTPETTYKHSIDYYGYFDSYKCYIYSTTNNRFEPSRKTADKYCTGTSGEWAGNFLNWATMTRMDIMRRVLYGGLRQTDTSSLTVLERAYLPTDAHAFAKYYNGSDIAQLTPVTTANVNPPTGTSTTSRTIGTGSFQFNTSLQAFIGDQIKVENASNSSQWMIGGVTATAAGSLTIQVDAGSLNGSGTTIANWTLTNLSRTGITLCNLTRGATSGVNRYSHSNTNAPIIRVANGNYALWGANERWQCYWSNEKSNLQSGFGGGFRSNGNRAYLSGINSSAENPNQTSNGLLTGSAAGEFDVRVVSCDSAVVGDLTTDREGCKRYGATALKPVGLLQIYGDSGLIHFGTVMGTFSSNISGGVLRKAAQSFANEVNVATDGTFINTSGIVSNLNKLRMYGYDYSDGTYIGADGCSYQGTGILLSGASSPNVNQGNCSSWGNPMSEIYFESLRYLAGASTATSAFSLPSGSKDSTLGLSVATWSDPLTSDEFCSALTVLNFNASVSSYDSDQITGTLSSLNSTQTAAQLTNIVGVKESINGANWFAGNIIGATGNNDLCSSKSVTGLADVLGVCPEAPSQEGSYLMAGLAYHAKTNRIRTNPTNLPADAAENFPDYYKVTTYGVALATNVPRIEVMVGGKKVTILPAYRLDLNSNGSGPFGGGSIVDFKIIQQTPTYGRFYVNWEDSEMGGDYDQDMWGTIEYTVNTTNNTITITTDAVSASTSNGQGFGYVISGTDKDGPHFHSGIYNFDFTDPTNPTVRNTSGTVINGTGTINASGGCNNCVVTDGATSVTYNVTGNSAGLLKDPLWYASKYGGFTDKNKNNEPDLNSEWDEDGDGNPDTFVFAINPFKLVAGLTKAFDRIARRQSSSSAVAANSTRTTTDSAIFQARFENKNWGGNLYAFKLNPNTAGTNPATDELWNAQQKLPSHTDRKIFTWNGTQAVEFKWDQLSTAQKNALNKNSLGIVDGLGEDRLNYLRGDRSKERQNNANGKLRDRRPLEDIFNPNGLTDAEIKTGRVIGPIISSDPFYVRQQYFGYDFLNSTEAASYRAYVRSNLNRTPVVYVGANDGKLHAFNASTSGADAGKEIFSYIPSVIINELNQYTDTGYTGRYYMDGSPVVLDAYIARNGQSASWKSVLLSGMKGGGKAIIALDVTNPDSFSASNVMWEFTDPDLCYTYSQPIALKLANGKWAAVFGSGYPKNGDPSPCGDGKARLFVVDLQDGSLIAKISTEAGSTTDRNGLSTPTMVDVNSDLVFDVAYAGDLQGNLWKFDLSNSNPANWKVAYTTSGQPVPIFKARNATGQIQPITTPVEIERHPKGGYILLFGTGSYVATTDPSNTQVQSLYGIWDSLNSRVPITTLDRSQLLQQTITAELTVGSRDFRQTSANTIDWSNKQGWYLDLQSLSTPFQRGERVAVAPLLVDDRVLFTTLIPNTAKCSFGGTSWLLEMNYLTGEKFSYPLFDSNGDGVINSNDGIYSGIRSNTGIQSRPSIINIPPKDGLPGGVGKVQQGTNISAATGAGLTTTLNPPSNKLPRTSWRPLSGN